MTDEYRLQDDWEWILSDTVLGPEGEEICLFGGKLHVHELEVGECSVDVRAVAALLRRCGWTVEPPKDAGT